MNKNTSSPLQKFHEGEVVNVDLGNHPKFKTVVKKAKWFEPDCSAETVSDNPTGFCYQIWPDPDKEKGEWVAEHALEKIHHPGTMSFSELLRSITPKRKSGRPRKEANPLDTNARDAVELFAQLTPGEADYLIDLGRQLLRSRVWPPIDSGRAAS